MIFLVNSLLNCYSITTLLEWDNFSGVVRTPKNPTNGSDSDKKTIQSCYRQEGTKCVPTQHLFKSYVMKEIFNSVRQKQITSSVTPSKWVNWKQWPIARETLQCLLQKNSFPYANTLFEGGFLFLILVILTFLLAVTNEPTLDSLTPKSLKPIDWPRTTLGNVAFHCEWLCSLCFITTIFIPCEFVSRGVESSFQYHHLFHCWPLLYIYQVSKLF